MTVFYTASKDYDEIFFNFYGLFDFVLRLFFRAGQKQQHGELQQRHQFRYRQDSRGRAEQQQCSVDDGRIYELQQCCRA